jgi:hypothetical protein
MASFVELLRGNRNYRYTWIGQVVSEVGDHFNNIAVFSLALATTRSGLVVSGVMLARAIPAVLAGPIAGVVLDRLNRKHVMIASDVIRAVLALGFILTIHRTLRDSAQHRHQGRAAYGEFADANHRLGDADHWHFSGRRERGEFRLSMGLCGQRAFLRHLRDLHLAAVSARRRLPAQAPVTH